MSSIQLNSAHLESAARRAMTGLAAQQTEMGTYRGNEPCVQRRLCGYRRYRLLL